MTPRGDVVRLSQNKGPVGHGFRSIMNRTFALVLAALAAAALFAGLVYVVLRVAHVSEPAASTVHGTTAPRLWATASAALALGGVVAGGLALVRPAGRFGGAAGRLGAALAGVIASVGGALVLAFADGGPGSGNGVVGGAAALVLGVIAIVLGVLALARTRSPGRQATVSARAANHP